MTEFLMFLTVGLWVAAFFACLFLVRYNGRRIWKHGGTHFLEATDGGAKLVVVGTVFGLVGLVHGLQGYSWEDFPVGHCLAALAFVAGLLALCQFCVRAWRQVQEEAASGPALESDAPIENVEQATGTMRGVLERLSSVVSNTDTAVPLTIAVTGRWGSGKTSLMRMVQREVGRAGFPCVWFNAWHHQREGHLFAALMEAIRREVEQWPSGRYVVFRINLVLMRVTRAWRRFLILLLTLSVLVGGVLWVSSWPRDAVAATIGLGLSLLATYSVVDGYKYFLKTLGVAPAALLSKSAGLFRLARFSEQLGFRHEFGVAFKEVCEAFGSQRLVVVIDDLDRCKPEQVVTTLEAVNFLTSHGECIVILGIEEGRVKEAVGRYWSEMTGAEDAGPDGQEEAKSAYADRYLEKLVGFWIRVPTVTGEELLAVRE